MHINPEKIKFNQRNAKPHEAVWIYNASIILEFLTETYVPTKFFLVTDKEIDQTRLTPVMFKDMTEVRKWSAKVSDMYKLYIMWRDTKDYTVPIESENKFGMILRKMRYYKNGWEFIPRRLGVIQIPALAPVMLRTELPNAEPPVPASPTQVDIEEDVAEWEEEPKE